MGADAGIPNREKKKRRIRKKKEIKSIHLRKHCKKYPAGSPLQRDIKVVLGKLAQAVVSKSLLI